METPQLDAWVNARLAEALASARRTARYQTATVVLFAVTVTVYVGWALLLF